MNIFGVGLQEAFFIVIIMLILLGPRDMVVTARKVGLFIRKVVRSPFWSQMMETSREIRDIPTKIVREAGIEEDLAEFQRSTRGTPAYLRELNRDLQSITTGNNPALVSGQKNDPYPPQEINTKPEEIDNQQNDLDQVEIQKDIDNRIDPRPVERPDSEENVGG